MMLYLFTDEEAKERTERDRDAREEREKKRREWRERRGSGNQALRVRRASQLVVSIGQSSLHSLHMCQAPECLANYYWT